MQKLLTCVTVLLLGWGFPTPRAHAADLPPAQEILDRCIEATGGKAALEKLRTRVMTGTIEVLAMGASGKFEVRAKAPNLQTSALEFTGLGTVREGYDGKVAWTAAPFQGVREKAGAELARAQRTMWFPRELHFGKAYTKVETKAAGKIGTQATWVVEGTPQNGKPDRLHFDQKTGLLLREEALVETAVGELAFEVNFSDYRDFDGVKVACSVRVPSPPQASFHIKIDSVKHNVELSDTIFHKPKE